MQAQYEELVVSQEIAHAKKNNDPDLYVKKRHLELVHQKVGDLQAQVDAAEFIVQCDEADTCATANEVKNNAPPSYYVSQITKDSYTRLTEYCSAKRLYTADREYEKHLNEILQIEEQIDDTLDQALDIFGYLDNNPNEVQPNYALLEFTPDFLIFIRQQLELIGKELTSSIVTRQVQDTIKRFAQDILTTSAEQLLLSPLDDVLIDTTSKIQTIVNQRLQNKASAKINECITFHLMKFTNDLQHGKGKKPLKYKVKECSNELLKQLSATYVEAVFTSIENLDTRATQFSPALFEKLAEQIAIAKTKAVLVEQVDHQDEIKQQLLKDHLFELEQERLHQELSFSHQLAAQLLNPPQEQILESLSSYQMTNSQVKNLGKEDD